MYKSLKKIEDNGNLLELVKNGIISASLFSQYNTYKEYLKINTKQKNRAKSILRTSINCNMSKRWIQSIVKRMEC